MKQIIYFGYSDNMVKAIADSKDFQLMGVIGQKHKADKTFSDKVIDMGIPYSEAETSYDLQKQLDLWNINPDAIIMFKFGIIVSPFLINKYNIFNVHPGNLKTNRGATPVNWSILLGEKNTCLSLHKINEKIDQGELIKEFFVDIEEKDSPSILQSKLETKLDSVLLTLNDYLNGNIKTTPINGGIYRKRLIKSDYTINLNADTKEEIKGKINSQRDFKGAVLIENGTEHYIVDYEDKDKNSPELYLINSEREKIKVLTNHD